MSRADHVADDPRGPLLDVTRPLTTGHPTWPGDVPFELASKSRIAEGDTVNVNAIHTSLHVGTHVDAPWHYDDDGGRLGDVDLRRLLGEALVLDVSDGDEPVTAEQIAAAVHDLETSEGLPPRVLLHTGEADDWGRDFPKEFRSLEPGAIVYLAERGVRLLGTDAPSVDALDAKDLPTHRACAEHDVTIVEGLRLARIAPGRYELLCLPLSLPDADGSPVRALLRAMP
jgi:arylformamidase